MGCEKLKRKSSNVNVDVQVLQIVLKQVRSTKQSKLNQILFLMLTLQWTLVGCLSIPPQNERGLSSQSRSTSPQRRSPSSLQGGKQTSSLTPLSPQKPLKRIRNSAFITLDKKRHELKEFEGSYVVLHFFTTWCKPCLNEIKVLNVLNQSAEYLQKEYWRQYVQKAQESPYSLISLKSSTLKKSEPKSSSTDLSPSPSSIDASQDPLLNTFQNRSAPQKTHLKVDLSSPSSSTPSSISPPSSSTPAPALSDLPLPKDLTSANPLLFTEIQNALDPTTSSILSLFIQSPKSPKLKIIALCTEGRGCPRLNSFKIINQVKYLLGAGEVAMTRGFGPFEKISGLPLTYIISPKGEAIGRFLGHIPHKYVMKLISDHLLASPLSAQLDSK